MKRQDSRKGQGGRAGLVSALVALCLTAQPALGQVARAAVPQAAPLAAAPGAAAPGAAALGGVRTLTDMAAQIETLLARGESGAAVEAGRAFLRSVTQRAGFGVANARLTEAPAEGFGMFDARASTLYRIGDPVFAYVEVNGFSLTPQPDGRNQLLFDVSFTIDSLDGRQMTDAMIPMGEVRIDTHGLPLDAFFHLTYRVTGAEGPFRLRTEVVDRASGQVAEFVLPVEFRSDPPPATK